jgi:transmembrane sensor
MGIIALLTITPANMKFKMTKELLFTHFMGKTSAMQKQMIDEWALEPANEEQFYSWLEEYEALHPEYDANVEKAINDYHVFLSQGKENSYPELVLQPLSAGRSRQAMFRWVAAATVLLVLASGVFFTKNLWQYQTYKTAFGETKSLRLSDGSRVTLNANSSLRVPRWGFGERTRNVLLEGEATFSVKHTATDQKFVVQTAKKFEVEVLGTEFLVFARKRSSKIVLNKGKVQLNLQVGNTTRKMLMKPGDLITLDNENHAKLKNTRQPEMHAAWQGHRYIFEKTTLQEIIFLLAENYGIQAEVVDKELLGVTLSGALTIQNADELLELVREVLVLRVQREGNQVYISQFK